MATANEAPPTRGTKGLRTRQRLLEQAVESFAQRGYRHTSVSEVARSLGITPGAVYAHFESKDALFRCAVDADAEALISRALTEAQVPSVRDRVALFLEGLARLLPEHPLAHRVLAGHEPEVLNRLLTLPSVTATTEEFAAELAAAQRAGEVRADVDPRMLAAGLESAILALLLARAQLGEPVGDDRYAGVLVLLDAALSAP